MRKIDDVMARAQAALDEMKAAVAELQPVATKTPTGEPVAIPGDAVEAEETLTAPEFGSDWQPDDVFGPVRLLTRPVSQGDEHDIRTSLRDLKEWQAERKAYQLFGPIEVVENRQFTGRGVRSPFYCRSTDAGFAIGGAGYHCGIRDLAIDGRAVRGGPLVRVSRMGPSCEIDGLVTAGGSSALWVDGIGERSRFVRMDLRNATATGIVWEGSGYGATVHAHVSGCTGHGMSICPKAGKLVAALKLLDCTIQGNDYDQLRISGDGEVRDVRVENLYAESNKAGHDPTVNLRNGQFISFDEACRLHTKTPSRHAMYIGSNVGRVVYRGWMSNLGNDGSRATVFIEGGRPERFEWLGWGRPPVVIVDGKVAS